MVIFKKHHFEHSQKYVLHISEFSCRHFIKMTVILIECLFPQNNIFTKHQFRQMPSLVFHFATKLFFFPDLVIEKKFKLKIVVKNSLCHANFKNRKPFWSIFCNMCWVCCSSRSYQKKQNNGKINQLKRFFKRLAFFFNTGIFFIPVVGCRI